VKVWGLTNSLRGPDGKDIDEERLDAVESEGSRGDEELEDGEEAEQHPGRLPSKDVLLPPQRTALPPRTSNPASFFSPSPLTSAAAADEDLGKESPVHPAATSYRRRRGVERMTVNISGRVEASGSGGLGCTAGLSTATARRERGNGEKGENKGRRKRVRWRPDEWVPLGSDSGRRVRW
jgi:hypothetical protein